MTTTARRRSRRRARDVAARAKAGDVEDEAQPASRPRRAGSRDDGGDDAKPAARSRRAGVAQRQRARTTPRRRRSRRGRGASAHEARRANRRRRARRGRRRGARQRLGVPAHRPARAVRRRRLHLGRAGAPLRAGLRRSRRRPSTHAASLRALSVARPRRADQRRVGRRRRAPAARYEDLPVDYPSERIALDVKDPTLEAIEWLTPFGRGSRVLIVGGSRAGKTETLRALFGALAGTRRARADARARRRPTGGDLAVAGRRAGASRGAELRRLPDTQAQAVERALDAAKRVASRGGSCRRADRQPRRAAAARRAQGARRRAQPARRRLADVDRDRRAAIRRREHRDRARRRAHLDRPSADPRPAASGTLRPELLVGDGRALARRDQRKALAPKREAGRRAAARSWPTRGMLASSLAAVGDAAPGGLGRELDRLAAGCRQRVDRLHVGRSCRSLRRTRRSARPR